MASSDVMGGTDAQPRVIWQIVIMLMLACWPAGAAPAARPAAQDKAESRAVRPAQAGIAVPVLYVVRHQYASDHHNTATLFQAGEINHSSFRGGSALKILEPDGRTRTLLETATGVIRDPDLYFDADRVLFSMRRDINDDYHIYEMRMDGSGLRALTWASGVSDIDPVYLPDGGIVFSSTREPKYCMCNRHIMANLFRMEADGANIQQIGKSTLFEGHGSLLEDGRIVYDRWEYVDRNFGDAQGLWTVRPDGTNHAVYWGNNINSPGGVIDARAVPGTEWVVCTFTSCHDRPWGAIALLDRQRGVDAKAAVLQTWPASAIDLVGVGNYDTYKRVQPKYEDPYPLDEGRFLCARMTGRGEQMGLYVIRRDGPDVLLHAEEPGCFDPIPVRRRRRPPVIAAACEPRVEATGIVYVADVYEGTHMQGVEPGAVRYLRVVESPEKRFWVQPPWEGQGQEAPAMGWHDFNNKRILGTAEVAADGSVAVEVPADRFVYFQLLDEDGMMIQSMRSGTIVRPGEVLGCVGCHESRLAAPRYPVGKRLQALTDEPQKLAGWFGPPRLFSYVEEVQPVWDKYCVRCHDFGKKAGRKLVLAGDRTNTFNASYNELWRKGYISAIGAGPHQTQPAYGWGSHRSRVVQKIRAGHKGVRMTPEDFRRVVTWIDINAPYYPTYASAYPHNLSGRSPLSDDQLRALGRLVGVDFFQLAHHAKNRGPQVSFDRPELSPCLRRIAKDDRAAYAEALAILQAGRDQLARQPRADMAGFVPWEVDRRREQKYLTRRRQEALCRQAIRAGGRVYDPPMSRRGGR